MAKMSGHQNLDITSSGSEWHFAKEFLYNPPYAVL